MDEIHKDSSASRRAQLILRDSAANYLQNWHNFLNASPSAPKPEALARFLGAHLLDVGFSPEHLYRWLKAKSTAIRAGGITELLVELIELESRPIVKYEVLVPVIRLTRGSQAMPDFWMEATEVSTWLARQPVTAKTSVRHSGAFRFSYAARDPWRAVELAGETVEALRAQVTVGALVKTQLDFCDFVFVDGSRREYSASAPSRQVDIHALSRKNALFDPDALGLDARLRSAMGLLESLERGSPGAAVAGGWAAIEALVGRQETHASIAADEMASLVACSWPRAELTTLAYKYVEEQTDDTAKDIERSTNNRERSTLMLNRLQTGTAKSFVNPSDQVAALRMLEAAADPTAVLSRVKGYASQSLRRLYRQRNLAVHAGVVDSVAMASTLRCAPPLVGAAIDRIVHATLDSGEFDPHALIARAELSLRLATADVARQITELLD
jgi:hypothetical protein